MKQASAIPASIIIGALLISLSILISSGVIKTKSSNNTSNTFPIPSNSPEQSLDDKILTLAKEVKVDTDKFKNCFSGQKYQSEISNDESDASTAGITGTPGFIIGKSSENGNINGVRVTGAYSYNLFKSIFDQLEQGGNSESIIKVTSEEYQRGVEIGATSLDDDPVLGEKNAPITMVEFSDYECPFCKRHFSQTLPSIKSEYIDKGKVKLVYRDFIAVPGHNPAATKEGVAANCVREQGGDSAYFKFHDLIFSRTRSNGEGI